MISICNTFLSMIGMPAQEVDRLARSCDGTGGLAVSYLFSFAGGGDRRGYNAFRAEPEPRRALLVGMADRYGDGALLGAIREICVEGGHDVRAPTPDETAEILAALDGCASPHASLIADALRAWSAAQRYSYEAEIGAGDLDTWYVNVNYIRTGSFAGQAGSAVHRVRDAASSTAAVATVVARLLEQRVEARSLSVSMLIPASAISPDGIASLVDYIDEGGNEVSAFARADGSAYWQLAAGHRLGSPA